ncbi:MAG: UvrD-helicase domain-containing protein [Acidobacteriota bacterium]|nr:UvrD-helicase domain-containing protein [Acidobacteriota bacterium]
MKDWQRTADQSARDRIRDDLDTTLVVEAAAGTGKTTALVDRILFGIISGRVSLGKTVAVTFTDFAAGELKLRLRSAIEAARHKHESSPRIISLLTRAVRELEEARIGTIHSFCADLLREHPVEAGIDPLFEVAPDDLACPLFDLAFERWFEKRLAAPGEGVRRILRRLPRKGFGGRRSGTLARRPRESGPKPILRAAARELARERDFTTSWKRFDGFAREVDIDALILEMEELGEWSEVGDPEQWLTKSLAYLKRFVAEITRLESLGNPRDYDGIEARLFGFLGGWGRAKDWKAYYARDSFPADEIRNRRDELKVRVQKFVDDAGADLAPRLREELWPVVEEFEQLKERAGYLDFLDLLLRARNLIRDNRDIRIELQQRFTHIFVDEFQDTDPLQADILMLLAADDPDHEDWRQVRPVPGKLFIVGDPKQSIYRFRRADVALYQEVKRQIVASGGALVELNVSFRSGPEIQKAVNAAFAPVMSDESSTQAHYVPLAPSKTALDTQPAIVALPVSQPYGDFGRVVDWKIDESLPKDVAAFLDWMVNESGWTVTERERAERVPLQPRHICLLFRRLRHYSTDVARPYVQALEAHRIPHLLVGGSSFHSREEVEAIRNALTAVEWPNDELAVFATLKGPLFAFTDSQLLAYRSRCSTLHPFKKPPDDSTLGHPDATTTPSGLPASGPRSARGSDEVTEALGILRELHRRRNARPIADTVGTLLAQTRAHAGFANWPTGEQALANIMRLTDMARRAERNGLISFRAFVDWLDEEAESGEIGDAPIMEEGVDGVRIMTVHKAKGLEFPVVVLVDITAKDSREPSKWVDQASGLSAMRLAGCTPIEVQDNADEEMRIEKEEAARVLYVAATRARDLLVVCGVGDHPYEGWLATLNPVLYPAEDASFKPLSTQPNGCPQLGDDNVVGRLKNAVRPRGSVSPGLHRPKAGKHHVVWWDPSVLRPISQGDTRSRLTEFLKEDENKVRSEEGIRVHQEWQRQRANVRQVAGKPEWKVVTATTHFAMPRGRDKTEPDGERIEASQIAEVTDVAVESIAIDFSRPHGKRFGILVHAVLSIVPLNSGYAAIADIARGQGRILGATEDEVAAAAETVHRALRHPLMQRAAAAANIGRSRREVPIGLKLDDGVMVEGVIDLAFQEQGPASPWTVIDYKTDFEVKGRLEEYQSQVSLYALAISRATGLETRPVLLRL